MNIKTCNKCNIEKSLSEFFSDKTRKDGYSYKCKECFPKKIKKQKIINGYKNCTKCNNIKHIEEFYKNPGNTLGFDPKCKICKNEYRKDKNLNKWNSKYNQTNKEYRKKYFQDNKENIYKRLKEFKHKDKTYHIGCILRTQLNNYIRKGKGKKHTSVKNLIGCDIEFFKNYISNKFLPEMTWENYGNIWELDHIIPLVDFNLNELKEQQKAFNYINYQPLFKTTEIAKKLGYDDHIGNRNKNKNTIKQLQAYGI
jgi:hypothetical protein